jgi:hypothetical protein
MTAVATVTIFCHGDGGSEGGGEVGGEGGGGGGEGVAARPLLGLSHARLALPCRKHDVCPCCRPVPRCQKSQKHFTGSLRNSRKEPRCRLSPGGCTFRPAETAYDRIDRAHSVGALVCRDHDSLVTLTRRCRRRSRSQSRLPESKPIDQSSRLWVGDAKVHRKPIGRKHPLRCPRVPAQPRRAWPTRLDRPPAAGFYHLKP